MSSSPSTTVTSLRKKVFSFHQNECSPHLWVPRVLIFTSMSFSYSRSFRPFSIFRSLDVSSTTSSGSSSLGDCYNTNSGMEANSCSPMSSSCSPRPSLVDGVHSSPDEREDRGGDGNVSFSDSDHHRYSTSHDDDMIMDSLKWY